MEAERTKSENWFHRVRVNQGDMTDSGVQYKVDYKKNNKVADIDLKWSQDFP